MAPDMVKVYNPTTPPAIATRDVVPGPDDLNGKVVGFLENRKQNAELLLLGVSERLAAQYRIRDTIFRTKPVAGPAAPGVLDELASRADFVISGTAD